MLVNLSPETQFFKLPFNIRKLNIKEFKLVNKDLLFSASSWQMCTHNTKNSTRIYSYLSTHLSSQSICLSVCLSVYLPVVLCLPLFICSSICLCVMKVFYCPCLLPPRIMMTVSHVSLFQSFWSHWSTTQKRHDFLLEKIISGHLRKYETK